MSRTCTTCQHLRRPEIDRRLAAGEPAAQIARDYELNPSSLHRHRANCLKLASSNEIKKDAARGTAAVALLPSKETLSGSYFELRDRIDQIVAQAEGQGSLRVALSGLNFIRQTLDSLMRLAGHDRPASTAVNVAVQTNIQVGLDQIAERLIQQFDHEPELKARIALALLAIDQPSPPVSAVTGLAGIAENGAATAPSDPATNAVARAATTRTPPVEGSTKADGIAVAPPHRAASELEPPRQNILPQRPQAAAAEQPDQNREGGHERVS